MQNTKIQWYRLYKSPVLAKRIIVYTLISKNILIILILKFTTTTTPANNFSISSPLWNPLPIVMKLLTLT